MPRAGPTTRLLSFAVLCCLVPSIGLPSGTVGLYDRWEIDVTNPNTYTNPFDFNEIALEAAFRSPSSRVIHFYGFFDGDGMGGESE